MNWLVTFFQGPSGYEKYTEDRVQVGAQHEVLGAAVEVQTDVLYFKKESNHLLLGMLKKVLYTRWCFWVFKCE